MGDDSPPPAPAPVIISPPPSLSQTAGESADAQVEAYKKLVPIMLQYGPELAQSQTDIARTQTPQWGDIFLENQRRFSPQLLDIALSTLKQADPEGFSIRKKYGQQVDELLDQKGSLSPEELRNRQQDFYSSKISQGINSPGVGDLIDETKYLGDVRYNRHMQALANAASFLNNQTPQASFASLNQAGKTAPVNSPSTDQYFQGLFPSTNQLIANQASNYGTFADFTGNLNALNSANHWNGVKNTGNPFLSGLAGFASFAAPIAGGILGGPAGSVGATLGTKLLGLK